MEKLQIKTEVIEEDIVFDPLFVNQDFSEIKKYSNKLSMKALVEKTL